MGGDRSGAVRKDVIRLFEGDSVAALGEGELLRRFADRHDEAAFEALVGRLGPMVLGIARRMLADAHDVEDVFQATFLVLVRKAGSIRDPDLVAPWLYGVALKVARRARVEAGRRKTREQLAVVSEAVEAEVESTWPELRSLIDEEIGRLPEDHRRAVVLCDVEGLSREEAAVRLGWTLNMVRGRLERARGRLRNRLARRGLAPSGAWLAPMLAAPAPSSALLAATIRAALAFSTNRLATGLASASAVALSQGVLRMMMLSKLKLVAVALLSAGFVAGGSGWIAAQGTGEKPAAKPESPAPAGNSNVYTSTGVVVSAGDLATLVKNRVEAAQKRWETQRTFYDEGRITIDRLLNASQTLMEAESDASDRPDGPMLSIIAHLKRIKDVEEKELAELEVGRATKADVEEIQTQRLEAEFRLARTIQARTKAVTPGPGATASPPAGQSEAKTGSNPPARDRRTLDQERLEIARRLYSEAQRRYSNAIISVAEFQEAAITLAKAEEIAAGSQTERVAAIQNQVDQLKAIVAKKQDLVKDNRITTKDADLAQLRLIDAESHLLDATAGTPDAPGDLARRIADLERKVDRLIYLIDAPKR